MRDRREARDSVVEDFICFDGLNLPGPTQAFDSSLVLFVKAVLRTKSG